MKKKAYVKPEVKGRTTNSDSKSLAVSKAMNKLISFNRALNSLGKSAEDIFREFDTDSNSQLSLHEFKKMIMSANLNLNAFEINSLFDELDEDKSNSVSTEEFYRKVDVETKTTQSSLPSKPDTSKTKPTATPTADNIKLKEEKKAIDDSMKRMGTSTSKVNDSVGQFLSSVKILPEDKFMGKDTILNDPIKALKVVEEIVSKLRGSSRPIWDDPDFGPQTSDPHGFSSICFENPFLGAPNQDDVFWSRLEEICKGSQPDFLVQGAQSNDVCQGAIGDCWMIGAMSVLATDDRYIRGDYKVDSKSLKDEVTDEEAAGMLMGVYPPLFHEYRKFGIYVLRFFKNYAWRYIIIDDKLPCFKTYDVPELIFASCSTINEFWVPLMEKAYAKLHGCYQALISGDISDALVDYTGLVSEKLVIQDKGRFNTKFLKSPDIFWEKMMKYKKDNALMGCSIVGTGIEHSVVIDGMDTGLLAGHAYSVQTVFSIKDKSGQEQRLIRVRNPWGTKNPKEWTLKWSDDSDEMVTNWEIINKKLKEIDGKEAELIDLNNMKDGTFFMCYDDFLRVFCKLSVCVKFGAEYQGLRFTSSWKGESAGGTPYKGTPDQAKNWFKNHQYFFSTKKKTNLFISLGQKDGRLIASGDNIFPFTQSTFPMVVVALRAEGETKVEFSKKALIEMSPIKQFKEICLNLDLEAGSYVIVPSTMDIGQEGDYYLNLYHNGDPRTTKISCLDSKLEPEIIPEEEEEPKKIDPELKKFLKLKVAGSIYT